MTLFYLYWGGDYTSSGECRLRVKPANKQAFKCSCWRSAFELTMAYIELYTALFYLFQFTASAGNQERCTVLPGFHVSKWFLVQGMHILVEVTESPFKWNTHSIQRWFNICQRGHSHNYGTQDLNRVSLGFMYILRLLSHNWMLTVNIFIWFGIWWTISNTLFFS